MSTVSNAYLMSRATMRSYGLFWLKPVDVSNIVCDVW